jgi:glycosyltransferase involved in cell wall biosynthesis
VRKRTRLSVCYAAPGQSLLPSAGPTRNVLNVAEALSEWADVTVAFRTILEPIATSKYRVIAIDPRRAKATGPNDDNAARGFHPLQHLSYCHTLRSFARRAASGFDVVLEKGWRLSGFLSASFCSRGVSGVLVENDVRFWTEPVGDIRSAGKYALHHTAEAVAGYCCRRLPSIIAETEELKELLVKRRRISPDRIQVIGLGVDHGLFRPSDQRSARESLGISADAFVLLYVGGMDEYHDLRPVIEALGQVRPPSVELHVVGDGEYRVQEEANVERVRITASFHGQVPYVMVPRHIAAADLCIAPYRVSAFHNGVVTFSTLKIPEYLACGRPVASVPSPAIQRLITDCVNGFVFPNDVSSWVSFMSALPPREQLATMGRAAAEAVTSIAWENTAKQYFEVCERLCFRNTRSCELDLVKLPRK